MVYATDKAFLGDIHDLKLLRNSAEVWRWSKCLSEEFLNHMNHL